MFAHFEDGPPNVPARDLSTDVVERGNSICRAARLARAKLAMRLIPACTCGNPAVVNGLCRGCDEDTFYRRDIPSAKLEGAE